MTGQESAQNDPIQKKIDRLSSADIEKALDIFEKTIHSDYAAYLNSCVHCGLCANACHYYLANGESESIPAFKLNLIHSIFQKHLAGGGKLFPFQKQPRSFDKQIIKEWIDTLFGRCSLCGRCTINCSIGINITALIRAARTALASIDLVPPGLQSTVNTAVQTGNNMGIPKNDWVETVEWLSEELQDEVDDPEAKLPLDKKNVKMHYTVNPREPKFFPLSLVAVGKIFYAARESWTFSSDYYDVTNYGLYSGDDKIAGQLSDRLIQSTEKLNAEILVLGECGHGFNSNRWEAPEWLAKKYPIEVKSIIQIVVEYIKSGRIRLDPNKNQDPVTLHDPCNLVRLGGIIEEQRFILKRAATHFIEMVPNRENNFCCGGGGGQLAMTRYASRRLEAGRLKAEQIKKTGAKIVVAPCHNCIDQLSELNKEYKLGIETKTVCEIVANALVIDQ